MVSNALEVEGLTKIYPDGTVAVDDLDFAVGHGEFCVIIGPSGCGKTTTLKSIIGSISPTEGRIEIGGEDVTDVPTYRRDIGLVFQDFQLFPHLSVEENIRYGPNRMAMNDDTVDDLLDDLLDLMRIRDIRDQYPAALSQGQQQRVALARSLIIEPEVMLLDEPLGDLDYKLQLRMEQELLRIHREFDTTFVHVTHDQRQAMRLADHLIVLHDGKLEQAGPIEDIYTRPATAFVASFVGDSNLFYGTVSGVTDGGVVTIDTTFGEYAVTTDHEDPASIVGADVSFAVRPQFLRLGNDADNVLDCDVRDIVYKPGQGTKVVLSATDADGVEKIVQLNSRQRERVDADTARVGWDAADAIFLERTSVVPGVDLQTDILGE